MVPPVCGGVADSAERHALERQLADLGAGERREVAPRGELRVALDPVRRVLHRAGRHAGPLEQVHHLVAVAGRGPGLDVTIERVGVLDPAARAWRTARRGSTPGRPRAATKACQCASVLHEITTQRSSPSGAVRPLRRATPPVAGREVGATGPTDR